MKRFAFAATFALAFCANSVGTASGDTAINFDDHAVAVLTNQYASQGLVFDGAMEIMNETLGGVVMVTSPPNYVDLSWEHGQSLVTFVLPSNPNVPGQTNFLTLTNIALNGAGGGFYNGIDFTALAFDGSVIDTASIPPTLSGVGRPESSITLSGLGIHQVRMTVIPSPSGVSALAPMDNWSFGTITAVPEPGTSLAVIAALAAAGSRVRRDGRARIKPAVSRVTVQRRCCHG